MKVLVSAASKHGATADIAHAIGDALTSAGIVVDVRPPEDVDSVEPYDGVVLGSAVYAGRWLDPMKRLVDREAPALTGKPVWLFSSGPIGDPPKPLEEPADGRDLGMRIHALDHRVFPGRLERRSLGLAERAIIAVVHAPDGDFRTWEPVAAWARSIADSLEATVAETSAPSIG